MKNYISTFFSDTNGAEAIEFVAIVIVAAVLIGIIATIGGTMSSKGNDAADQIKNALDSVGTGAPSSTAGQSI